MFKGLFSKREKKDKQDINVVPGLQSNKLDTPLAGDIHPISVVPHGPVEDSAEAAILFVDDDSDLRQYVSEELSEEYNIVYVAANGKEAIKVLEEKKIDLVVSDVMMPVMDGQTLCATIKVSDPTLPVILLTARADNASRAEGLNVKADDYIQKPFDVDELLESINRLLK